LVLTVHLGEVSSLLIGEFVHRAEKAQVDRLLAQAPNEPLQRRSVFRLDLSHLNLRAVGQHHRPVLSAPVVVLLHVVLPGRLCLDCICCSHIVILYGLTTPHKVGTRDYVF
jgi:hypothetical protein